MYALLLCDAWQMKTICALKLAQNQKKKSTVLSVNEYTPFEKYNFKQYLNEHKNHFQNVDKIKFNITSV